MPKILPQNRPDYNITPPEPNDIEHPYHVKITSYKWDEKRGILRLYYEIIAGEHAGRYHDVKGFHNSFILKDDKGILQVRANALDKSNPGLNTLKIWEDETWDDLIGCVVGVTYALKNKDGIEPEVMQDKVVAINPTEQPAPAPCAPEVVPAHVDSTNIYNISHNTPLFVDTRQHEGKHDEKHAALQAMGYALRYSMMDTGDYKLPIGDRVVDTKHGLGELADNVSPSDRTRFVAEMDRAREQRLQMLVLVTEPTAINGPDDIINWTPAECHTCGYDCDPRDRSSACMKTASTKPLAGEVLLKAIEKCVVEHGATVRFVRDEVEAAEGIHEWLTGRRC